MAEKIPLNKYKRITIPLQNTLNPVYSGLVDRANIIVTAIASNISNNFHKITLSLSSINTGNNHIVLTDYLLNPLDCTSIVPFKLALTEEDTVMASADILDLANSEDESVFWFYTIPVTGSNVEMQFDILAPTSVVVNWGTQTPALSPISGSQTVQFTYLPYTVPSVNLTLSILETNNSQ